MITVVNKRGRRPTFRDVFIGRGSPLGNPFTWKRGTKALYIVQSREESIEKYGPWLDEKIAERDHLVIGYLDQILKFAKEGDVYLVCYCAPDDCHGRLVKDRVEARIRMGSDFF